MTRDSRGGRSVACPTCEVPAGERCITWIGPRRDDFAPRAAHPARINAARQRVERQERKGRLSAEERDVLREYRMWLADWTVIPTDPKRARIVELGRDTALAAIDRLLKERGHR